MIGTKKKDFEEASIVQDRKLEFENIMKMEIGAEKIQKLRLLSSLLEKDMKQMNNILELGRMNNIKYEIDKLISSYEKTAPLNEQSPKEIQEKVIELQPEEVIELHSVEEHDTEEVIEPLPEEEHITIEKSPTWNRFVSLGLFILFITLLFLLLTIFQALILIVVVNFVAAIIYEKRTKKIIYRRLFKNTINPLFIIKMLK